MVNYKNKENFLINIKRGEIIYANHKLEFLKFFESHKRLCDEISGLKYHTIILIHGKETKTITKINFILGIKKLNSFLINYSHYLEQHEYNNINNIFNELYKSFINDKIYQSYVKKSKHLTISQEIDFNKKYINYLVNCFDIAYLMNTYLQKSLNIASREVIKTIQFANYDGFFNNLSDYKDEMSNDLANISLKSIFDNFKKILGFFYTYRYLILKREQKHIMDLLKLIHHYIVEDTTIKTIIKLNSDTELNTDLKKELSEEFIIITKSFNTIYRVCNRSFSNKNILPKSKKDVLIDTTLI